MLEHPIGSVRWIAQHRLKRGPPGVGAQHEDPVEARLLGELAGIDLE
jgi:hypothetical protein